MSTQRIPSISERQRWLLLFLALPAGPCAHGMDQVRAMKGMFLLGEEVSGAPDGLYEFVAGDYGPFASKLYGDLASLRIAGLISERLAPGSRARRLLTVTPEGEMLVNEVLAETPQQTLEEMVAIKRRVTSHGFRELLTSISEQYPDWAVASASAAGRKTA